MSEYGRSAEDAAIAEAVSLRQNTTQYSPTSAQGLKSLMGDEYNPNLTPQENIQAMVKELKQFRKLAQISSFYIQKIEKWLEETNAVSGD